MPKPLDARGLNRALLARQLLLARRAWPAMKVIEQLAGLQAQAPLAPYVGLWTRIEGFRPDALARALRRRRVVRIVLMRSTIHLVTARDCLAFRPVVQPLIERSGGNHYRELSESSRREVAAAARTLLEHTPRTLSDLGAALRRRWPRARPDALMAAARNYLPLVQIPPRGIWGEGGMPVCATAEAWLGKPLGRATGPDALVRRYLAAFGPASVHDAQAWSGLTRLRDVFERMRGRLVTFHDAGGVELFDLPRAPRPDPDTPAPPRFLPEFDNLLVGHADRTRVLPGAHRARIAARGGMVPGAVLLDGFVMGTWTIARARKAAILRVTLFSRTTKADRAALEEEGSALLAFAAGGAAARAVRFT